MQTSQDAHDVNRTIAAIDVHGHYGLYSNSASELTNACMTGDADTVCQRARLAHIRCTVVSALKALVPRGNNDPVGGNEEAAAAAAGCDELLYWTVVDPLKNDTLEQARRLLSTDTSCQGIKIHPEEHRYRISDHGRALFEFAAEQECLILTHSGEENSLPADYLPFADDFPDVNLILAHLGCSHDDDPTRQVRAVGQSRHGNVYVDTSSASNVMPRLIEWAVGEIGADKMLFGTDTPLYYAPMQRARIDYAEISTEDKRKILASNAERMLGLDIS